MGEGGVAEGEGFPVEPVLEGYYKSLVFLGEDGNPGSGLRDASAGVLATYK